MKKRNGNANFKFQMILNQNELENEIVQLKRKLEYLDLGSEILKENLLFRMSSPDGR